MAELASSVLTSSILPVLTCLEERWKKYDLIPMRTREGRRKDNIRDKRERGTKVEGRGEGKVKAGARRKITGE